MTNFSGYQTGYNVVSIVLPIFAMLAATACPTDFQSLLKVYVFVRKTNFHEN